MSTATPANRRGAGGSVLTSSLEYVEGIGPVHSGQLEEIGIRTPQQLLDQGATPKGRTDIADRSGISTHLILEWVNHVDLYRINGVGSEYADLLEAAGVDTVVELAQRNAQNLYDTLVEVNQEKRLVRRLPSASQVGEWVQQAKNLPRVIQY
jgi:predicted flap endonuclease-1-like 5' DNA nuclease